MEFWESIEAETNNDLLLLLSLNVTYLCKGAPYVLIG